MKKLVPDPPPVLALKPGLTHDDAIRYAFEHLEKAIVFATRLPDQAKAKQQADLEDTRVHLRMIKAFLRVALARSTQSMPI